MRYFFVRRFAVENRFHGSFCQRTLYVAPVVLFGVFGDRIVLIVAALSIASVSALEHVEVEPFGIVVIIGRCRSSPGVKGHKVVGVVGFYGTGQSMPYFRFYIALNISADDPDDIGRIFVPVG